MDKLTGKELGRAISDFVNSASSTEIENLLVELGNDHRTLQEQTLNIMFSHIIKCSDKYSEGIYDSRNRYTYSMCNKIAEEVILK